MPSFFLVLGAVTLLAAIIAFWQSARLLFAPVAPLSEAVLDSSDRASLLDQKAAVLRSLKDLELDRSTGKLGEADYAKLEAEQRARAKEILRALAAETSPFRAEAEKLFDDAAGKTTEAAPRKKKAAKDAADAKAAPEKTAPDTKAAAEKAAPEVADEDAPDAAEKAAPEVAADAAEKAAPEVAAETPRDAEVAPPEEPTDAAADARPECAKCGTANDADAAFCKKCGTKLGAEAAS